MHQFKEKILYLKYNRRLFENYKNKYREENESTGLTRSALTYHTLLTKDLKFAK